YAKGIWNDCYRDTYGGKTEKGTGGGLISGEYSCESKKHSGPWGAQRYRLCRRTGCGEYSGQKERRNFKGRYPGAKGQHVPFLYAGYQGRGIKTCRAEDRKRKQGTCVPRYKRTSGEDHSYGQGRAESGRVLLCPASSGGDYCSKKVGPLCHSFRCSGRNHRWRSDPGCLPFKKTQK